MNAKKNSGFRVHCDGQSFDFDMDHTNLCDLHSLVNNKYQLRIENSHFNAQLLESDPQNGIIKLKIGRKKKVIRIENPLAQLIGELGFNKTHSMYDDALVAPMPGLVLDILVKPGQKIEKGDHLITLEAMKMENILRSQHSGIVREISVEKSDKVEKNQTLILFESSEDAH
ncbi:MAG: acetyl-CoA carboxylase biotin carboxyl carrier protein subunit [Saprospiraceae bacterium]|nr:acetyl-CoA carboxylase biotin carboxyl carrier protein subunit [Saprospiraceae bacterium]